MPRLRKPNEIILFAFIVGTLFAGCLWGLRTYLRADYNRKVERIRDMDHDSLLHACRGMMERFGYYHDLVYGLDVAEDNDLVTFHLDQIDFANEIPESVHLSGVTTIILYPNRMTLFFRGPNLVGINAFSEDFENEFGVEELRDGLWLVTEGETIFEHDLPDHPPSPQ